ncbi:c-type cytochrome [Piscinibacter sakaiensis]|uniref:c-type cytochrome n=1 Tax=Piscinibacter sakaiensis TaxID=1547922 RepID=UPI003AAB8706
MRQISGKILMVALAAGLGAAAGPVHAAGGAGADRAQLLAAGCTGCHGTNGHAQSGGLVLAGMDRAYFIAQMKAFKSGQRPATVMHQLAKGYGDAEIETMASFFASQRRQGGGS